MSVAAGPNSRVTMNTARTSHKFTLRHRSAIFLILLSCTSFFTTPPGLAKAGTKAAAQQTIPLNILAGALEPLQGDDPSLPEELIAASRGKTLVGSYRICIMTSGSVQSVTPLVGIAGADQAIMRVLKGWKFQKLPLAICKTQTFTFEVD